MTHDRVSPSVPTGRLAIMIPTYNGGGLLRESVESCGAVALDPDRDAVLVIDNGSQDGSTEALPDRLANGVQVRRWTNAENVGRIGNWNQALRRAEAEGFEFGVFLFVGDLLMPGDALHRLLHAMNDDHAVMGMAPNCFLREDRTLIATAQRVRLDAPRATIATDRLLERILSAGALLLGPLQANVFRLSLPHLLVFDEAIPTHTDQLATVTFLHENAGPVTLIDEAFMGWRTHAKRFHASMGVESRLRNDLDFLARSASRCGLSLHWSRVHASVFLQYVNNWLAGREMQAGDVLRIWRALRTTAHGISTAQLFRLASRRAFRGRGLVSIGAHDQD